MIIQLSLNKELKVQKGICHRENRLKEQCTQKGKSVEIKLERQARYESWKAMKSCQDHTPSSK